MIYKSSKNSFFVDKTTQQTQSTLLRGLRCESMQTQIEFEWLIRFENIENERRRRKQWAVYATIIIIILLICVCGCRQANSRPCKESRHTLTRFTQELTKNSPLQSSLVWLRYNFLVGKKSRSYNKYDVALFSACLLVYAQAEVLSEKEKDGK